MKKVAVISGGSDGLGKEIAKKLVSSHTVVILAPNISKLEMVAKEIGCDFVACDVSDFNQCRTVINTVISRYQRVDILINNAGIWIEGPLESNSPEDIKRIFEVNTLGTIYLSAAVLPHMKTRKEGLIINVISQAGLYPKSERSVYNASKWALTGFTKSLELEVVKFGIRVSGFYPGKMNTKLFEKSGIDKPMNGALDPEQVARIIEFMLTFDNNVEFPEIGIKPLGT